MKKVCICGSFGFGKNSLNGQTIKTKIVTDYYRNLLGEAEVKTIDTQGLLNFILVTFRLFFAFLRCKNIIILPAQNSLRLLAPICRLYQSFTSKKTHYSVIGGWLPHYLLNHPIVFWGIKSFEGIYVETNTMRIALNKLGLMNVQLLPNCKQLNIEENDSNTIHYPPLKLCTFSRINRMKGIDDAVVVVDKINKDSGGVVVTLDIYGSVDAGEQEWFNNLNDNLPEGINIKGAIDFDKSVSTLKNYHALLFPTKYYTEGIPGTIIDAYAAGLPVIASKWESCEDVVQHLKTGFIYEFENNEALKDIIKTILNDTNELFEMKSNCLKAAHNYLPQNVMPQIRLK